MKKFFIIGLLLAALTAAAQTTNNPPVPTTPLDQVVAFFSQGTNWTVFSRGLYDMTTHKTGVGIGALYDIPGTQLIGAAMELEYLDRKLYLPTATIQFHVPMQIGPITATPLAYSGIGTPLGSQGVQNGNPVGILGTGAAIKVYKHISVFGTYEHRTGGGINDNLISAGASWRF